MTYKVVDLKFQIAGNDEGDRVAIALEHGLPDRVWEEQVLAMGYNHHEFTVTLFERGFEDRPAVLRLLRDLGHSPTESVAYL